MTIPPQELRRRLVFYRDLGIETLVRRDPANAPSLLPPAATPEPVPAPTLIAKLPEVLALPPAELFAEEVPANDSLLKIREDIGDCVRCRLCESRDKIVFGSGPDGAKLVFVGEGPGADEDASGQPFVGRAGQLLTQMIDNTAAREGIPLRRGDVYVANVVKCRPPENRTPLPDEQATCGPFLERQLAVLRPNAIVALGGTAAQYLTGRKESMTKMRGRWLRWRDVPLVATWHPSYLLRGYNQEAKREAWEDLKKALHYAYDGTQGPEA